MAFLRVDRRGFRTLIPLLQGRGSLLHHGARPLAVALFLGLCGAGVVGCEDSPTGPSLSAVTLQNMALASTTGNPGLCCCRVVGAARNGNTVPVHVTIKFQAANPNPAAADEPLSTILFFIRDLQPGATAPIDAAGFVFPCATLGNSFGNVRTEIDVKGIAFPPG
jgi:hypothetical protein